MNNISRLIDTQTSPGESEQMTSISGAGPSAREEGCLPMQEESELNAVQVDSGDPQCVANLKELPATCPAPPTSRVKLEPAFALTWMRRFAFRTWKDLKQGAKIFGFVLRGGAGTITGRRYSPSGFFRRLLRLFSKSGRRKLAAQLKQARAAKSDSPQALTALLNRVGATSSAGRSIGYAAAAKIGELMSTDRGRDILKSICASALKLHPDSTHLIYMHVVIMAKNGRFDQAHKLVTQAIKRAGRAKAAGKPSNPRALDQLTSIWRTIDLIARDGMSWTGLVDDGGDSDSGSEGSSFTTEKHLQQRNLDKYIQSCRVSLKVAPTLLEKLKIVESMTRQGVRRVESYGAAYDAARRSYQELRELWWPVFLERSQNQLGIMEALGAAPFVQMLLVLLRLSHKLGFKDDATTIEGKLFATASDPSAVGWSWAISAALVARNPEWKFKTTDLLRSHKRNPVLGPEVKGFFSWCVHTEEYKWAEKVFNGLPSWLVNSSSVSPYVQILQRRGRHSAAVALLQSIEAGKFESIKTMDPFAHWRMIKRVGGLRFAQETAKYLKLAPQPSTPKGILFVTSRDLEQTSRMPLVVLTEVKKLGWAVIPLFEGILPFQATGIEQIDKFGGCLGVGGSLTKKTRGHFMEITDFHSDSSRGELRWGDIDLSHALWEEAAVNRRRFNIDYNCPALVEYLDKLANWTRLMATVLENARKIPATFDIPVGFIVNFQARLPDAVVRFYCERVGDPDRFFCVQGTNGYQNYFANFSSKVSTRMAVRNMTRSAVNRTASFPTPDEFNSFYEQNQSSTAEMLERVSDITKMRRSTGNEEQKDLSAGECIERIRLWRAEGGKVACAFGKVVCDSAVPYDGGPAHRNIMDWINHTISIVAGTNTMLLIKPHPHENKNEIAAFLTETFRDLITEQIPDNVIFLGHNWFDMHELKDLVDLGLVYNGTTTVELGLLQIPAVLCSHFAPIDYPIGQAIPSSRAHYERLVRFEEEAFVAPDVAHRAAAWLCYLSGDLNIQDYRYHARPITNKTVSPPWWFKEDIKHYVTHGDPRVTTLARRIVGDIN